MPDLDLGKGMGLGGGGFEQLCVRDKNPNHAPVSVSLERCSIVTFTANGENDHM